MTREDTKKMFQMIYLAYPNFEVSPEKIDFWYEMLKDMRSKDVKHGLTTHIKTKNLPPTIAELRRFDRTGGLPEAKEINNND